MILFKSNVSSEHIRFGKSLLLFAGAGVADTAPAVEKQNAAIQHNKAIIAELCKSLRIRPRLF